MVSVEQSINFISFAFDGQSVSFVLVFFEDQCVVKNWNCALCVLSFVSVITKLVDILQSPSDLFLLFLNTKLIEIEKRSE